MDELMTESIDFRHMVLNKFAYSTAFIAGIDANTTLPRLYPGVTGDRIAAPLKVAPIGHEKRGRRMDVGNALVGEQYTRRGNDLLDRNERIPPARSREGENDRRGLGGRGP